MVETDLGWSPRRRALAVGQVVALLLVATAATSVEGAVPADTPLGAIEESGAPASVDDPSDDVGGTGPAADRDSDAGGDHPIEGEAESAPSTDVEQAVAGDVEPVDGAVADGVATDPGEADTEAAASAAPGAASDERPDVAADEAEPIASPSDVSDEGAPDEPLPGAQAELAAETAPGEQETTTGTILRTGNAVAVGNGSETYVTQVVDVLLSDAGRARVEQVVLVINVGAARAITGGNAVTVGGASDTAQLTIRTGDALAVGNLSVTEIDQRLALALPTGELSAAQVALVSNTGVAIASSGGDRATAANGTAEVATGDAYAIGNLSEVAILQLADVDAHGDASVAASQAAVVVNRGLAVADSGGAVAAAAGGSLTTGLAIAEGNVSSTAVTQRTVVVSLGSAEVEVRQGAIVLSLGVAIARSGGNGIGSDAAAVGASGFELAVLELVLTDLDAVESLGGVLLELLAELLGQPLELLLATEELRVETWQDAVSGRSLEVVQRTLIFDLGVAIAVVGDDVVVLGGGPDGSDVQEELASRLAEVRATVETGDATAFGNVSLTVLCQRLTVDRSLEQAPSCVPPPMIGQPAPDPGGEPPEGPTRMRPSPEPEVLSASPLGPDPDPVTWVTWETWTWWTTWWWQPAGAPAALPRTGGELTQLLLLGSLLVALGLAVALVGRRHSRAGGSR
jgi:hypothetical protein